jgi:hypothetical protein
MMHARTLLVAAIVLSIVAGFAVESHPHFEIESLPGFGLALPLFGALGCAVLAGVLRALLSRQEDPDND